MQHITEHCNTLQRTEAHRSALQHSAQHTATHYNSIYRRTKGSKIHIRASFKRSRNTLQHTATHCNTLQHTTTPLPHSTPRCKTLQHSAIQYIGAPRGRRPTSVAALYPASQTPVCVCAVCCSVLQCVAVCCSVLQCVAVCCSVLQCVAALYPASQTPKCVCACERERECAHALLYVCVCV